jgi:hypothetical protein
MILVNHLVVVTQEQWNLLALGAEPTPTGNFMHDEAWMHLTSLPVLIAPDDGTPIDCGDGWLAVARWDTIYAWNDALLKEELGRAVRESSHALYPEPDPPMGLFQQRSLGHWDYPLVEPRPKYTFGDFGGIA